MIMLDRWKELAADSRMDKSTVEACQSLASEMCRDIFDRLGLDVQPIENALRVSGRGSDLLVPHMRQACLLECSQSSPHQTSSFPPAGSEGPAEEETRWRV